MEKDLKLGNANEGMMNSTHDICDVNRKINIKKKKRENKGTDEKGKEKKMI